MSAREAWRGRLGLETGGPGWKVQGPPAPLSPVAEMALLAIREMRRTLQTDMAIDSREINEIAAHGLEIRDMIAAPETETSAQRQWWKRAGAAA